MGKPHAKNEKDWRKIYPLPMNVLMMAVRIIENITMFGILHSWDDNSHPYHV